MIGFTKSQTLLGGSGGGETRAIYHYKQTERSFQVGPVLATWSPGRATIKHHRNVLIRPGLQVLLCLDGIQLCSSLLSHTIHPVVNSFLPLAEMGSRVKQVAFKGMKEKRGKENTESKGRNGEASTTVHRPRSHWLYC